MSILKINFEILVLSEFVRDSLDPKCWTYISEEGVPHFRYENLISRVDEGHEDIEEAHVDSVIYENVRCVDGDLRIVQFENGLSGFD